MNGRLVAFAVFGTVLSSVGGTPISREKIETVTVTFATAAEAQKAEMKIAPLYGNAPMCFTTRWDDSSWLHPAKAEMFRRIGLTPCFFLNHSDGFAKRELPKIKALGGRFGNHSYSHPFLMESGVNRIFFEVVANKVWIESVSDTPCTTFSMPYNWGCQLEPGRAAKLAKILVDSGTFVSSNGPVPEGEQPPQEWCSGYNFNIGDGAPRADHFWSNVKRGLEANEKDGGVCPKLTLGTHSSPNAGVNEKQEEILKDAMQRHPEWWWTDDAHYGAYRYEYWHSKIVKKSVKGNVATFEVTRHDPAFLGEIQALTYVFGDLKPVKIETSGGFDKVTALPWKIDTVKEDGTSDEFPGVKLRVKVDEAKGLLGYVFEGGEVLEVLINPAPMWANARMMFTDAKKEVSLGARNPLSDYQDGDRLYCVGVDFMKDGKRGRVYSLVTVEGAATANGRTPRDCAMVLGPFESPDIDDAFWAPKSVSNVELPNLGEAINQYWRSMADPLRCGFSAAAYIGWDPSVKPEFKEALKRAKPSDRPRFLVALDFVCEADGEKDFLCNVGDRDEVVAYVNGEKLVFKGGTNRIKVRKGRNRLLYRWVWTSGWTPQAALIAICDEKSVDKQVKFMPVNCQKRDCVFTSNGFSTEFDRFGNMQALYYKGAKVMDGIALKTGGSLALKKDAVVKPTFVKKNGRMTCTIDAPTGTKSDDLSYRQVITVSENALDFEVSYQVRDGVAWKGIVSGCGFGLPLDILAGRPIRHTARSGKVTERTIVEKGYEKANDLPDFKSLEWSDWRLTIENGGVVSFFDRRQWGADNRWAGITLHAGEKVNYGAPTVDSKPVTWKWRFERTGK